MDNNIVMVMVTVTVTMTMNSNGRTNVLDDSSDDSFQKVSTVLAESMMVKRITRKVVAAEEVVAVLKMV